MADDLPDKLDKLEIAPSLPHVKLIYEHLPVTLNPFFDNGINASSSKDMQGNKSLIFNEHQQRSHKSRLRRCSESILDEFKLQQSALFSTDLDVLVSPRATLKLNKIPMKKNGSNVGRKVLLREPLLRAFQTCFDIRSTSRRKRLPASEHLSGSANSMSDFRDLKDECDNMLMDNVNFNSNLNNLSSNRKSSKKLNTVQVPNLKKEFILPYRSGTMYNSIIPTESSSVSTEPSTSLRARTSCSQQAASQHSCCFTTHSQSNSINTVNTVGTTDDVTIDELASYFDTLVHIPKKMSSMAEMMYI